MAIYQYRSCVHTAVLGRRLRPSASAKVKIQFQIVKPFLPTPPPLTPTRLERAPHTGSQEVQPLKTQRTSQTSIARGKGNE